MDELNHNDEPLIPSRLVSDLRRLYRRPGSVPTGVDEAILSQARSRFAGRRRVRLILALAAPAAAAAAIAGILIAAWPAVNPPALRSPTMAKADPADMDGNGRVDILDALVLARRIESGHAPTGDLNGDGRIDSADVEAIARSAVRLDRGSLQ